MSSVIIVMAIIVGAGWIIWRCRRGWQLHVDPRLASAESPETLAFAAFTHGKTGVAAGQFAVATAAFERACARGIRNVSMWPIGWPQSTGGNTPSSSRRPSRQEGKRREELLRS